MCLGLASIVEKPCRPKSPALRAERRSGGPRVKALLSFSRGVDRLSLWIGQVASLAMLAACVVSCGNALSRYSLSITSNFWLEIQWYLFGAMFMLGAAYTLKLNEHVRVDLVYGLLSPRARLIVDILGTLFFLIPTCVVGGWLTFWFFWDSWATGEQAANAVGLPRWPAKLMFPLGFSLLLLQAVSELIKRFEALTGHLAFDTAYEKPVQ
jgi:TRAP-type mannitol/chloroaromatic compound transport system permease small subunit